MTYRHDLTFAESFLGVFLVLLASSSSELEEKLAQLPVLPSWPRWGICFFPFTRIRPLSSCKEGHGNKLLNLKTGQPEVFEQGSSCVCVCVFYTSGEGRSFCGWPLRGLVSSLLPRMARRCLAMTACCSTEQWFSKDRIRGYGDAWGEECRKTLMPSHWNAIRSHNSNARPVHCNAKYSRAKYASVTTSRELWRPEVRNLDLFTDFSLISLAVKRSSLHTVIAEDLHQQKINKSCFSYLEGVLGDGFNHLLERHFGGESVAVVYDRFAFISIPAVQLYTATALIQSPVRNRHIFNIILQDDYRV